jgi:ATP citrate (pro-S)-lyase
MIGSHPQILQSMLDFDFLSRKTAPSIKAIISSGRKWEKFFWGKKECLIPVYANINIVPQKIKEQINLFINVSSGRRALSSTPETIAALPNLRGGVIFAENLPEKHAIEIYKIAKEKNLFIIGPASVGLLIPNNLKLGAIGGIEHKQLTTARLFTFGNTAVLCSSGGMTNELINQLANQNIGFSFALAFGGDRFPILTPESAFLTAEQDAETKQIVYFGELGGSDEYRLAKLMKDKKITKPVIAYIAGSVASVFAEPPQFGHAKALAQKGEETAAAKKIALRSAGALVGESYEEFINLIKNNIMSGNYQTQNHEDLTNRKHTLFTCAISGDKDGVPTILSEELTKLAEQMSYPEMIISILLGQKPKSKKLVEFTELVLKLLTDHGPCVSGAVNTIISARAGKDLVSSLCSGLLTIGDRFGGAINEAAGNWLKCTREQIDPAVFVESFASQQKHIAGIGHKKYSSHQPDPRVKMILHFSQSLSQKTFTNFALKIERITLAKKANLILNVDGAVAAVMLDLLKEKEGYDNSALSELVATEFFNALFVLSRSVGFVGHYLDQRRLDEGLFRLPEEEVASV